MKFQAGDPVLVARIIFEYDPDGDDRREQVDEHLEAAEDILGYLGMQGVVTRACNPPECYVGFGDAPYEDIQWFSENELEHTEGA